MTAASSAAVSEVHGWRDLRHGGLLLDSQRLAELAGHRPASPLTSYTERQLRRRHIGDDESAFIKFVLEEVCGFDSGSGTWTRGAEVARKWRRPAATGEIVKPRELWRGPGGGCLPVFREPGPRVGIGKGRRTVSRVLGWLRVGGDHLALVTNGRQWRLLFAGLDFEAWCEWDTELWFQEGKPAPQVHALRTLLQPKLWTPRGEGSAPPLLQAIRDTRKGQAELSETLGERVREAVETLIQGHGDALKERCADVDPADIYRAACRVAMRLVVILFAESRDLLPRDNAVYHASYGLNGLLERLQKAGGRRALSGRDSAWPRVLALFDLVRKGSHLPQLPVKDYGGALFEPGRSDSADGLSRALAVFETACFEQAVLPDDRVLHILERMTRTKARIRQGRGGMWATVPVDFSDLSSDYIGILYEGLLDYELRTAPPGEPVIFLAAGQCPALPLSRLVAMDDKAIKTLFSNLKKDAVVDEGGPEEASAEEGAAAAPDVAGPLVDEAIDDRDERHTSRTRAERWARKAARVAGLFRMPRGNLTLDRRRKAEEDLARKARKLVARVVLPGEWYLVRWGGTRKGSGSFYTRPGLVVPTVRRTLQPLAYDPPTGKDGKPDRDAPFAKWKPKPPENILELKVCDPACGSGAFVLSALRFLTDACWRSLQHHDRVARDGARAMVRLLGAPTGDGQTAERLGEEMIPCPPDHDDFEPRLKAVLRRHVVERCIYAVDLDPLAVELCRLSLWIETMDRSLPFGFLDHKVKCGNSLVGAWLDQFAHYPVMAWKNREGGDKNHSNGVHFKKNARTKAIKAFVKDKLKPDLVRFLGGPDLFLGDPLKRHGEVHDRTRAVLDKMHAMSVHDATERARTYREEFEASADWRSLKDAMDLWCACWFWPAGELACAPLPTSFAQSSRGTKEVARRIAAEARFFHWELEFPDVFHEEGVGFDAVLGNPPWDIAKPNSREFFSNIDPLYRSYGKQEATRKQTTYFGAPSSGEMAERDWIDYNARFRAQSNFVKYAGKPFGDPTLEKDGLHRFSIGAGNATLHQRWRQARSKRPLAAFADASHPFRRQGSADLNLYKLFLEASYSLLRPSGRLGFIVPSGLYSDHGTDALRRLFLEKSRWEWLFGIENRNKIFPIHRNYKFNPVVVEKGGSTDEIRTAFMCHNLDDWDAPRPIAMSYSRSQVERFSPRSRTLLEVQSKRDLEILEKIYANGVLLGDEGPDGWGIRYTREFDMTNDSGLFRPRPRWEADGYRPDEYSRWLVGKWRPIGELWATMGVEPSRPESVAVDLEEWLFDASAGPERREARARFVHGALLKPGDVARTNWRVRCAQPPYDGLPVPRAAIPAGVILSRDVDEWIAEEDIEAVALPLYEGRMIGQFDVSEKGWVRGKGRSAVWRDIGWQRKRIEPQYLIPAEHVLSSYERMKIGFMNTTSSTNVRTMICSLMGNIPCGNSVPILQYDGDWRNGMLIGAMMNSFAYDFALRHRLAGLSANWFIVQETSVLSNADGILGTENLISAVASLMGRQASTSSFYHHALNARSDQWRHVAVTSQERLRQRVIIDALITRLFGLDITDARHILCLSSNRGNDVRMDPKGLWRIDKDKSPELRQTVLTLVVLHDLEMAIRRHEGDLESGLTEFIGQNNGEGWLVPEALRLSDYGLGHDERAEQPQPVASRLGPRFYDWQLVQSREEAWQECHLHARNLLGSGEYAALLKRMAKRGRRDGHSSVRHFSNDDTRTLVGDGDSADDVGGHHRQPLLHVAERKTDYAAGLLDADEGS